MGYTHYWKGQVPAATESLLAVIDFIQTKVQMQPSDIKLASWDGTGFPTFDIASISFNGNLNAKDGDMSHETCAIKYGSAVEFSFCKTAQKPYDIAVVAILEALNMFSDSEFAWTSDGDAAETLAGVELAHEAIKSIA